LTLPLSGNWKTHTGAHIHLKKGKHQGTRLVLVVWSSSLVTGMV